MDRKKFIKHLPLYLVEILVLVVAAGFLYFTVQATRAERREIKEENITVNEEVKEQIEKTQEENAGKNLTGVFNVALFGVDARDGSLGKGTRSDSIMICSIDMDKHEVKLISVLRDTYLNLGNDTYNKCNVAYAKGGPEQAISMLNVNTDMYIKDYITVGFDGLIQAVDALGGVELDVSEAEIPHLNNYQISMVGTTDDGITFVAEEGSYVPVTEPGLQKLNGLQATAYCRIRYVGDDFRRTQRQRDLITAMIEKSKTASIGELTQAAEAVFPYVSTSLKVEDIFTMLSVVGDYQVTVSESFPFAGIRNGGNIKGYGSCVVPTDLEQNVTKLHELLFDEQDYVPSEEVKKYSEIIKNDTQAYLQY